jgi:hypothetical protein
MGDSDSWKPGSRPGGNPPPAGPAAANSKPTPTAANASDDKPAGRVIHDERGNAVWDWLKDTARIAIDSTSRLLMRLEVPELTMEEDTREQERMESERDRGGGYDPYGGSGPTSGSTSGRTSGTRGGDPYRGSSATSSRTGAARGGANSATPRGASENAGPRRGTFGNQNTTGSARSGAPDNAGGGYDPYGKGITNKPTRKP